MPDDPGRATDLTIHGATLGSGGVSVPPKKTESGGAPGSYTITTTLPDNELRHNISDQELDMLYKGQSDPPFNVMLAAGGVAAGAFPQLVRDLYNAFRVNPSIPLDLASVLVLLLFGGAAAAAGVSWFFWRKSAPPAENLATQIRERTNRTLHIVSPMPPPGQA
jgi:hypothetical protein